MVALTSRQSFILDFIREHVMQHGFPPTIREICVKIGSTSPNGVKQHLEALERKGKIERQPNISRGIRVLAS